MRFDISDNACVLPEHIFRKFRFLPIKHEIAAVIAP